MCLPTQPFKVLREWTASGLSCAITQPHEAGFLCGYVRVPPGHRMHGLEVVRVDDDELRLGEWPISFSELEPCNEHEDGQGWWFGFDCGHTGQARFDPTVSDEQLTTAQAIHMRAIYRDLLTRFPGSLIPGFDGHYWTQEEVEPEVETLAAALAGLR